MTGRQMIGSCLALLAASLVLPVLGALLRGVGLRACAVRFACLRSQSRARLVPRASLIYLPGRLTLLLPDGIRHG